MRWLAAISHITLPQTSNVSKVEVAVLSDGCMEYYVDDRIFLSEFDRDFAIERLEELVS